MSKTHEIRDLEEVLKPYLGPTNIIVSYETKPLTSIGENFGSLMLALKASVRNAKTKEEKIVHAVAKMLPPSDLMKELFNVNVTFRKEVILYTTIRNELCTFANDHSFAKPLDFLPEYYGSRLSLNTNAHNVDSDAVLILENLNYSGYVVVDRLVGYDLATAKIILENLAVFHGISLAHKLLRPEVFQREFMPHLGPGVDSIKQMEWHEMRCKEQIDTAARVNKRCAELKDSISNIFRSTDPIFNNNCTFDDPYGVICHLDLWVNNILIKYVDNKPVKAKFVDFQVVCYGNLARDVVFFLFTSVQAPILEKHYDELVQTYHNIFVETLHSFGCNMKEYNLERLHSEMSRVAKSTEILHSIRWLKLILTERGTLQDVSNSDSLIGNEGTDNYKNRLVSTFLMFDKHGWLV